MILAAAGVHEHVDVESDSSANVVLHGGAQTLVNTDECFLLDYDAIDMPYGGALADAQANTNGGDEYMGGGSNNRSKTKSSAILNLSLDSDPVDAVIFRVAPSTRRTHHYFPQACTLPLIPTLNTNVPSLLDRKSVV